MRRGNSALAAIVATPDLAGLLHESDAALLVSCLASGFCSVG